MLEGKLQYLEFAGNLVPVTKSGEQLSLTFQAFRENRLPFTIRVKDPHQEPMGRVAFMREQRVGRGEPPQSPICNLNIVLPEVRTFTNTCIHICECTQCFQNFLKMHFLIDRLTSPLYRNW